VVIALLACHSQGYFSLETAYVIANLFFRGLDWVLKKTIEVAWA
jgi:hypothetical protein